MKPTYEYIYKTQDLDHFLKDFNFLLWTLLFAIDCNLIKLPVLQPGRFFSPTNRQEPWLSMSLLHVQRCVFMCLFLIYAVMCPYLCVYAWVTYELCALYKMVTAPASQCVNLRLVDDVQWARHSVTLFNHPKVTVSKFIPLHHISSGLFFFFLYWLNDLLMTSWSIHSSL